MSHNADEPPVSRWSDAEREVKLAEYGHAQDMLKHYDSLNWQIGSILIGANAVLLGLVANVLPAAIPKTGWWALLIAGGVAAFSRVLLRSWRIWFKRHRDLYNFRNETMHRIETQLGMYHFLRVVEAEKQLELELPDDGRALSDEQVRIAATLRPARAYAYGQGEPAFEPLYPRRRLGATSGNDLADRLAFWVPILELVVLVALIWALHR
jgi:hypothetical protein